MYKDVAFCMESLEQIEKDLKEAKSLYGSLKRIYLLNADPFALSADKLKAISDKIIEYSPEMQIITMYAAVRNIKHKSDEDLQMLRDARINDLWVGVETGYEESLIKMNKGHTLKDAYEQLERLNKVGIRHNDMLILGGAGTGKGIKCAIETAKLINTVKPNLIGFATMGLFEGSKLSEDAKEGLFVPATEFEVLEELKKIIELINVENMPIYADHSSNTTGLRGIVPRDKDAMINRIDEIIRKLDPDVLNSYIKRYSM
jgi:radical SAM superfamily enzyme